MALSSVGYRVSDTDRSAGFSRFLFPAARKGCFLKHLTFEMLSVKEFSRPTDRKGLAFDSG